MQHVVSFLRNVRGWGECALDLAFPWPETGADDPQKVCAPFCRQCGFPFAALEGQTADFTCARCDDTTWYFRWARAAYLTKGQVHEAVVGFKYEEQFYRRHQLVSWLTEAYDAYASESLWDALVPVPLFHRRRRERGFNQARELADGLASRRRSVVRDCLRRERETPSQTGLQRQARRDNMRGAFTLKPRFDLTGQNLLLIDDVFTTGATTNACARVLVEAGAEQVAVLTVARS